jgi:hypothetical protein
MLGEAHQFSFFAKDDSKGVPLSEQLWVWPELASQAGGQDVRAP